MKQTREAQIEVLKSMKVPDLQNLFLQVIGEPTKAPNKKFLSRRIIEALEEKGEALPVRGLPEKEEKADEKKATVTKETTPLKKMSVDALRELYEEVLGRPTDSRNRDYLRWKITQARAGKVRVGPARERTCSDADYKVLPVRLESDVVETMDAAWRRQGLRSRMAFFRHALSDYLRGVGETEAADAVLPAAE